MDFWNNINQNYAAVLSLGTSIITAIITGVYVAFTYRQMKATQDSVKAINKQFVLDKQPCIVPEIASSHSPAALPNCAINGSIKRKRLFLCH